MKAEDVVWGATIAAVLVVLFLSSFRKDGPIRNDAHAADLTEAQTSDVIAHRIVLVDSKGKPMITLEATDGGASITLAKGVSEARISVDDSGGEIRLGEPGPNVQTVTAGDLKRVRDVLP